MSSQPRLSVIVCTYDRLELLRKCLIHLITQKDCHADDYEIIVVDNHPSVNTRSLLATIEGDSKPDIRYVAEERAGLSHARNRGIKEAYADLVAFIDDDAYVDSHWVAEAISAFNRQPYPDAIGGKLVGDWQKPRPSWLHDQLLPMVGESTYGDTERVLAADEWPLGGNMAFRCNVLKQAGEFSADLGFTGGALVGLEEVDLVNRIRFKGKIVGFVPTMLAYHLIPADKLAPAYFTHRVYWNGRSLAIWHRIRRGRGWQLFQAGLRIAGGIPRDLIFYCMATIRQSPGDRFLATCLMWKSWGYFLQTCSDSLQALRFKRAKASK